MATEFFAEGDNNVAISLTPGVGGILQVHMDGEKIFDKSDEGGHPNLDRVKQMRAVIRQKIAANN